MHFILILFLSLMLNTGSADPLEAVNYGPGQLNITFESVSLEYDNTLGFHWDYYAEVNGNEIACGKSVVVPVSDDGIFTIKVTAVESDRLGSDTGSKSADVHVKELKSGKATYKTISVVVTEDEGIHTGKEVRWNFRFRIEHEM